MSSENQNKDDYEVHETENAAQANKSENDEDDVVTSSRPRQG